MSNPAHVARSSVCVLFSIQIETNNFNCSFTTDLLHNMARLNTEMHPLLTPQVLELLFGRNIYTVSEFIETDTKQLSHVMRFAMKARDHLCVK